MCGLKAVPRALGKLNIVERPTGGGQIGDGPVASVVIPCYNTARYLAVAIESALAQTYPRTEVVVVDDGSTDESAEIASRYGARIVFVQQPNRGLSAARNAGIRAASGDCITLLDADDVLLPECVERRVASLEASPEVGLVAGYFREMDSDGAVLPRIPEVRKVGTLDPFRQAVRRNWGPPVGWTFRREAFDRCGGFDPLLRSCEDWDFVIRVARRYAIGYDPTVSAHYRIASGQMSSNFGVMLDAARRVQQKNRANANGAIRYWVDCQFGRFELGRRILFAALTDGSRGRLGRVLKLVAIHPHLLWVGLLSLCSLALGKRPSAK